MFELFLPPPGLVPVYKVPVWLTMEILAVGVPFYCAAMIVISAIVAAFGTAVSAIFVRGSPERALGARLSFSRGLARGLMVMGAYHLLFAFGQYTLPRFSPPAPANVVFPLAVYGDVFFLGGPLVGAAVDDSLDHEYGGASLGAQSFKDQSQEFPSDIPYRDGWVHRVCTSGAVAAKLAYVEALLTQYETPNARGISESQIARVWNGLGQCTQGDIRHKLLSRATELQLYMIGYIGDYLTALVRWHDADRDVDYKACRYFVDDFIGLSKMMRPIARANGWTDWLAFDRKASVGMSLLNRYLARMHYPSDAPSSLP